MTSDERDELETLRTLAQRQILIMQRYHHALTYISAALATDNLPLARQVRGELGYASAEPEPKPTDKIRVSRTRRHKYEPERRIRDNTLSVMYHLGDSADRRRAAEKLKQMQALGEELPFALREEGQS